MALTAAQQAAGYYASKRRRERAENLEIRLTNNTVSAAVANGTGFGELHVINGTGFTVSLTDDASGKFSIAAGILQKAGTIVAGTKYLIVASATDGDTTIARSFLIRAVT